MNPRICSLLIGIVFSTQGLFAQIDKNVPQIGYLYPAGGRQGTTVYVTAGGQSLRGAEKVYVSGQGVQTAVIRVSRTPGNLNKEQREVIIEAMQQVRNQRVSELPAAVKAELFTKDQLKDIQAQTADPNGKAMDEKAKKILEHPLFYDLEKKSLRELAHIRQMLFIPRYKKQLNQQIADLVLIKVELAADAKPGMRQLRISSRAGLTNPVNFEVSAIPEALELEPNDGNPQQALPGMKKLPPMKPHELPIVLNGQIMPGDRDRFRFRAEAGQQLVVRTQARSLIPYLADAVPGWFQAAVSVYNAAGMEIAYADDFRFDPDPVLYYQIPRTGEYELEIHDAIYRGREDFVYRISVGQTPFVTQMFPLGVREQTEVKASVDGWNLPQKMIELKAGTVEKRIYTTFLEKDGFFSNTVPFAVDTLPEQNESDSNDTVKTAQKLPVPIIVNGRIESPGDADVFRIDGKAGQSIVAEIYARRLNSPVDSLLRLTDAAGDVVAWDDDHVVKDEHLHKDMLGLMTHHADAYLSATLSKTGPCFIYVTDSQGHGGEAYSYRLRISPPRPDFQLRATPSGYAMRAGTIMPITVHVLRIDGFDGEIEIAVKDPSTGFRIHGGLIPAGCERICMTLQAPKNATKEPVDLKLEGRAVVNGQPVCRPVVAAEDRMQAFLYRHLVPAESFMVEVRPHRWPPPPMNLANNTPVKLPHGQIVTVLLKTPPRPVLKEMDLTLYQPPAGITLEKVTVVPEGLSLDLKADPKVAHGLKDNLIIEAFREFTPSRKDKKEAPKKQRNFIGVLPAIPIHVVSTDTTSPKPIKTTASVE